MGEKLSEQMRRVYMVHVNCARPFTKKQVLEWMARVQEMEQEIEELRLHCWEGDVEPDVEANP